MNDITPVTELLAHLEVMVGACMQVADSDTVKDYAKQIIELTHELSNSERLAILGGALAGLLMLISAVSEADLEGMQ